MTANINPNQLSLYPQSLKGVKGAKHLRMGHSDIGYLYRYDTYWKDSWNSKQPIFRCGEYPIISETTHTYLIYDGSKNRRIYKNNSKAWAHRDIVNARVHYIQRKQNQYAIVKQQLDDAITVLRTIMEDWGKDVGELPTPRTVYQVYQEE